MRFRPIGNRLVESIGLWLRSPKRTPYNAWNEVHAGLASDQV